LTKSLEQIIPSLDWLKLLQGTDFCASSLGSFSIISAWLRPCQQVKDISYPYTQTSYAVNVPMKSRFSGKTFSTNIPAYREQKLYAEANMIYEKRLFYILSKDVGVNIMVKCHTLSCITDQ